MGILSGPEAVLLSLLCQSQKLGHQEINLVVLLVGRINFPLTAPANWSSKMLALT